MSDPAGDGGAGGDAGHGGVSAILDRGAEDSFVTHDPRWDPPEGLAQAIIPPSNATACTSGTQCPTGYCVDGFCCDSKCDNKCMACSAAKKGSGADGICGSIKYDTDPDNDCPYGACDGKNMCKNYNGFSCTAAPQCLSNYCVDGFCCNNICMGSCQACSAAKKGSGQDGLCGSIKAATDPDNECSNSDCNGSGACMTSPQPTFPNGTACTSATQCASGYCADGVCCDSWCLGSCQACTAAKKNQGTDGTCGNIANDKDPDEECWGGACNGAGVCKQYNGVPCVDKSQCLSNYCVDGFCCGNICTGWCYACSEARKGGGYDGACGPILSGRDPDSECTPGECNGSGTCNQPQTPLANGSACIAAGQCASGNCVDGYCCNTACTETCKACSTVKKGSGANGTCGTIASETDPDSECGVGGRCGGNGTCKYYNGAACTSTAQCFSNYCADGVCCGNICNQTCNACTAAKKGQGVDGACGPIANTRDPDNECNPGECNGSSACNQPQTPQPNGATCALATQCSSGNCVDGVCCDTACTGSCQACSATKKGQGTSGTCGPIKYDTDPDNECPTGACSGTSLCQSYNGFSCTQTTQCLSTYCVDGVCCGNICTSPCMACTAAKKGSGQDGVCGVIANNSDPDNECGLTCNGAGACVRAGNGTVCSSAAECTSNFCVDGVCCNTACSGSCDVCNLTGSLGTCTMTTCPQYCPGTVALSSLATYPTNGFILGPSVKLADFNGDGSLDVATASSTNVTIMLNQGNGSLGSIAEYPGAHSGVAAADFNGDGRPDVASTSYGSAAEGYGGIRVWLNQGAGTFGSYVEYKLQGWNRCEEASIITADFSNDGKSDIAVACFHWGQDQPGLPRLEGETAVVVFVNQGNGTFSPTTNITYPEAPQSGKSSSDYWLAAADINGDGKNDLLYMDPWRSVNLLLNQGGGWLTQSTTYNFSYPWGVVAGDLNGDGHADVVVGVNSSAVVMLNQGGGAFATPVTYPTTSTSSPDAIALVDLNGDEQLDIVMGCAFGSNSILARFNQGGGVFGPEFTYSGAAKAIVGGDMNGDDKKDLVLANRDAPNVNVLINQCLP